MLHSPCSSPPPVSVVRTPEPTLDVEFATQQEMNARIRSASEEELETIAEAVRPAPISHREGISDRDVDVRIRERTPAETASSTEFLQETVTTVTEVPSVVLARGISVEELETSQPESEQVNGNRGPGNGNCRRKTDPRVFGAAGFEQDYNTAGAFL